jgi:hypothetical protein
MTTIGQRLKQLRGDLSQAKLGKMIFGVDLAAGQAKIKRIEAGAQELTVSYEKPSGRAGYLMLRINRITGEAAILNGSGWMQLRYNPEEYAVEAPEPEAAPAPAPEPGKVW